MDKVGFVEQLYGIYLIFLPLFRLEYGLLLKFQRFNHLQVNFWRRSEYDLFWSINMIIIFQMKLILLCQDLDDEFNERVRVYKDDYGYAQ